MKSTTLISVILFLCSSLFSQSTLSPSSGNKGVSLKLHTAVSANFEPLLKYEASPLIPGIRLETSQGNIHQLELLHLVGNLGEMLPNNTREGFALGLRYEYAWALTQVDLSPWRPYLGFGVLESFHSWISERELSVSPSQRDKSNLIRLSLVPSIQYELGKKLFIDFSLPISFFDFQTEEVLTQTTFPGGIINIDKNKQAAFYLVRDLGLRFGIGLRL